MSPRAPALAILLWMLASGCQTPRPAIPLDPGDERPARLLFGLRKQGDSRRALRALARVSLEGPGGSGGAKQLLVLERPARLRVEVLGFLNQTAAVLVTDGQRYRLFRSEDRSLRQGPMHAQLLEEVAGVRLSPEEAVAVLLGTPVPARDARIAQGASLSDGGIRIELTREPGAATQRLEFDREARLRRIQVRNGQEGTLWEALFDDYRRVGEDAFAHSIELNFPPTGSRAHVSFREVELNPELPPDIFVLRVPVQIGAERGGEG